MSQNQNKRCNAISHPNIQPGWGCCNCRTYNGNPRANCKHCGHFRCDTDPLKQVN